MYDTLLVLNQMQLEGGSLLISKVYASVSAMEADTTPTSDLTGRALKPGQLVVIVTSDSSSSDMGSEYRFNGPGSWTYVGKVGGLPLDTVPTQSSTKGITSGGVYTALAAIKAEGYKYMGLATPGSGGTAPGTPNQPVFYIAGPGSYPNFGSITVASGYLGFIKYSGGSWTVESVAVGKDYDEQISELDGQISQLEAKVTDLDEIMTGVQHITLTATGSGWTFVPMSSSIKAGEILNRVLLNGVEWTGSIFVKNGDGVQTNIPNSYLPFTATDEYPTITVGQNGDLTIEVDKVGDGVVTQIEDLSAELDGYIEKTERDNDARELGEAMQDVTDSGTVESGGYIGTDGVEYTASNWEYITLAVYPGEKYNLTAFAGQAARLWVLMNGTSVVSYSSDSSDVGKKTETVTIPNNATTLILNARVANATEIATISLKMGIPGINANTVFVSPDKTIKQYVDESRSTEHILHYNSAEDADSYIVSPFNATYNIKTVFKVKRTATFTINPIFNFVAVYLVNKQTSVETLVHNCADDITPAQYNNTFIGGNHGDSDCRAITANAHGKTAQDIGSIWGIGEKRYTLVGVPDANTLWFIGDNTLQYPLFTFENAGLVGGATLTHISGATNTQSISIGSSSLHQWKAACISSVSVFADDTPVVGSGEYAFNKLKICENYDVLNPASVVEKIREGVGTFTETPNPNTFTNADKVARHSIVYEFDGAAEWRIATTFLAYQDINIVYFGYTQQGPLSGTLKQYIPKALPISNGQETVDFRTVVSYDSVPQTMTLTSSYWENPLLPPDRWVQKSGDIVLHSGYLFNYGVGGNNRKDSISRAIELNASRKLYPHGIDTKLTVNAGDGYSAVVWRSYKDVAGFNNNGIISVNVFEYAGDCYIYGDFNATGIYAIEIPPKFVGRTVDVFEKRDNVELLTPLSNSTILVKVTTGTPMYGYIVAKIKG